MEDNSDLPQSCTGAMLNHIELHYRLTIGSYLLVSPFQSCDPQGLSVAFFIPYSSFLLLHLFTLPLKNSLM